MNEKISSARKLKIFLFNIFMYASVFVVFSLLLSVIICIVYRGFPHISFSMLSEKPSLLKGSVGILPNILNTLYIVIMTLIFVIPLGVGSAVYLCEYAKNKRYVNIINLASQTLAGIPSIIYGLAGMLIFVQFFSLGTSLIAGSLTLTIMTLPTIMRTSVESIKSVPDSYREGALALGSGKWHMIKSLVLPSSTDGIVTGCIIAIGRIVGESAALLFTAGMSNEIISPLFAAQKNASGSTLAVALYVYAKERGETEIAFAIAAILLILTCILNFLATFAVKKFKKKRG